MMSFAENFLGVFEVYLTFFQLEFNQKGTKKSLEIVYLF